MKKAIYIFIAAVIFSCNGNREKNSSDAAKQLQEKLLNARKGDIIEIPEGKFEFSEPLVLSSVPFVTIRGKAPSLTVLSFKNMAAPGEGLKIIDCPDLTLENFSVHDTKADAIKISGSRNIVIRNVAVGWSQGPQAGNGSYGIHAEMCKNIVVEKCAVTAASSAGIFLSQSENIVIRDNITFENVAGIQTENCVYADIHNNKSYNNSGGILICDLPGLAAKNGHHIRIFENSLKNNNSPNFSSGGTAALLPSGTGILLLSARNVEIFKNEIEEHNTLSAAIISFLLTGETYSDSLFNPFTSSVFVHQNKFNQPMSAPDTTRVLGKLFRKIFPENLPHILFDGHVDPHFVDKDGTVREAGNLCLKNNGEIKFANINAPSDFLKIITDPGIHNCEQGELPSVDL